MVRDLALAALLGPGLVIGGATTLELAGVLTIEGLAQRLVTVLAVALAVGAYVVLTGLRGTQRTGRSGRAPRTSRGRRPGPGDTVS